MRFMQKTVLADHGVINLHGKREFLFTKIALRVGARQIADRLPRFDAHPIFAPTNAVIFSPAKDCWFKSV